MVDVRRAKLERFIELALGGAGCALVAWFVHLYLQVMRGPDDANPVAMLFLLGMLMAFLPALGVPLAIRAKPLGVLGKLWIVLGAGTVLLLAPFAWMFR